MRIQDFISKIILFGEPKIFYNSWKRGLFGEKSFEPNDVDTGLPYHVFFNESENLLFCSLYLSDEQVIDIIETIDDSFAKELINALNESSPLLFYTTDKYLETIKQFEDIKFTIKHL